MKINVIPMALVVFSFIVLGTIVFFNEMHPLDYGLQEDTVLAPLLYDSQATFNDINQSYGQLAGTTAESSGGNFLTDISQIWSVVKGVFNSVGGVTETTTKTGTLLNIPAPIIWTILALIIISVVALIVSVASRYKVD